jgi:hypothetical protein
MTEEQQDFVYTKQWLKGKLEADQLAAAEAKLEQQEERRKESARESYLASGGNPASFEKAYPTIREQMLRDETISREQANQQAASRLVRGLF